MFRFDATKVQENARKATTEDLLDRVTAQRDGLEPEAVEIIERELRARGVRAEQIADHAERYREVVRAADGLTARCCFCHRPAVARRWRLHRLWGVLPVFPRPFYYCAEHRR
ncbi:MAG: hypothetical protein IT429_00730 [Gemmataceae bacterium]|nr:hypothetical protein [Gemmataceae bacterium]